jgi:hypothetical protein
MRRYVINCLMFYSVIHIYLTASSIHQIYSFENKKLLLSKRCGIAITFGYTLQKLILLIIIEDAFVYYIFMWR